MYMYAQVYRLTKREEGRVSTLGAAAPERVPPQRVVNLGEARRLQALFRLRPRRRDSVRQRVGDREVELLHMTIVYEEPGRRVSLRRRRGVRCHVRCAKSLAEHLHPVVVDGRADREPEGVAQPA